MYERHIATELCTGIISSQFDTCSLHGFEKNVIVLATRDSSVLALDGETGNVLSPSMVHPKKPSRALFMQIIGNFLVLEVSNLFLHSEASDIHGITKISKYTVFSFSWLLQVYRKSPVEDLAFQTAWTQIRGILMPRYYFVLKKLFMCIPWCM